MGFYERYLKICAESDIEPCSQKTADSFGVTRATISSWNKNGSTPKGETVAIMADALGVSTDYLLERTDDPTDYSNPELIAELRPDVINHFEGDVKKAVNFQKAVDSDALKERNGVPEIVKLFNHLDDTDQARAKGIIEGMLMGEKYTKNKQT
jgi:transcriptional regulator with XRE-family HTH domain